MVSIHHICLFDTKPMVFIQSIVWTSTFPYSGQMHRLQLQRLIFFSFRVIDKDKIHLFTGILQRATGNIVINQYTLKHFIPYFIKTDLAAAPGYLFDSFLTPELWSSVFSVCIGASSLIGAAILSTRKQEEKCGLKVAKRLCVFSGAMIALTLGYWLLVDAGAFLNGFLLMFSAGCLLLGFLLSFINIPLSTTIQTRVEKDKLSKVGSLLSIGSQGMIPIASVLAGAALQAFGSSVLLLLCAVGFTVTAILMLMNKNVRTI